MNDSQDDWTSRGLLYCFVVIVSAVSLAGFLTGTQTRPETVRRVSSPAPQGGQENEVPLARSYREMRESARGPGSGWNEAMKVASEQPARVDRSTLEEALLRRQARRAYDGAPPTIPHLVQQNSAADCMACHEHALRLAEKQAPMLPHAAFTQCNQCHVPEVQDMPSIGKDPRQVPNSFQGQQAPRQGPRAWSIAPPQIPHTTFMRENCLACHGASGSAPMRSSHLDRQNCTQCHASSAHLDRRPGTP